jgi:DNA-binding MarR family transcriptional regulator
MSSLDSTARRLTGYLQQLINRLQFLKPPDFECDLREFRVIFHLGYNGPSIMREIADGMGIPVSTATGVVDRLVEKELVRRMRTPEDRRIVKVELADKGWEVFQWDYECHVEFVKQMLKCLDAEDRKTFTRLMEKVAKEIDQTKGDEGK